MVKLSKLDLQVMDALWALGRASVREIQETFDEAGGPRTRPSRRWSTASRASTPSGG